MKSSRLRKKSSVKNCDDYEFSIESILANPETRFHFTSYLVKVCLNDENVHFLDHVACYTLVNGEDRNELAKKIIRIFVAAGAEEELNLDPGTREQVIEEFTKQYEEHACEENLFSTIQMLVMRDLSHDSFQRFIKSEVFAKFMHSKDEQFWGSVGAKKIAHSPPVANQRSSSTLPITIAIPTRKSSLADSEDDDKKQDVLLSSSPSPKQVNFSDFSVTGVSEIDFVRMALEVRDHSQWEVVVEHENQYGIYKSKKGKVVNKNGKVVNQFLETGTLPFAYHDVLYALLDEDFASAIDNSTTSVKCLDFIASKNSSYKCSVIYSVKRIGFPAQDRDFLTLHCLRHEQSASRFVCVKQGIKELTVCPKRKGVIRARETGGFVIERIDDHNSRYNIITMMHLKGWLPNNYWYSFTKHRETFYQKLKAVIERRLELNLGRPMYHLRILDSMDAASSSPHQTTAFASPISQLGKMCTPFKRQDKGLELKNSSSNSL